MSEFSSLTGPRDPGQSFEERIVLTGKTTGGFDWHVTAGGNDSSFLTLLTFSRNGKEVEQGGFVGARRHPSVPVQDFESDFGGLGTFIVVRTEIRIDRVVVLTESDREIEIDLSDGDDEFELKFGVAAIPTGESVGSIRAEVDGHIVLQTPQVMRSSERDARLETFLLRMQARGLNEAFRAGTELE